MEVMAAAVTPELVRWAYRLLLGREPESEQVLETWASIDDFRRLREEILGSLEFGATAVAGRPEQGEWAEEPASRAAILAMLRLRDGADDPDPGEVAALLSGGHSLRALRRALLASPALEPWLPRREGLRRRVLRLGESSFTVTGDSRDAQFMALPSRAPALASVLRALWEDGGAGRVLVDAGAGIGVASLAMVAGAPRYGQLLAFETVLPRVAMLAANIGALPRVTVRATPPPLAELLRDGHVGFLRLASPDAAALLLEWGEGLRGAGVTVLLRLDLAALLLEQRLEPRGFLARLLAEWPAVASLGDIARPRLLAGEAGVDEVLRATLADPGHAQDLLLTHDAAWLERYSLA